jgi:hypothetical protein
MNSPWNFAVLSVQDVWSCGIAFLVSDIQISGVMVPQRKSVTVILCIKIAIYRPGQLSVLSTGTSIERVTQFP